MLLSISVVLSIIESFIPIFSGVLVGVKLGLANIVVIYALYKYGFKDAFYITILRVILVGILRTGLFSITFFSFIFSFKKIFKALSFTFICYFINFFNIIKKFQR